MVPSTRTPRQHAAPPLLVRYCTELDGEHAPAGWIYATGGRELCVFLWRDATWTLAARTVPGFYGDQLATGRLAPVGVEGYAVALGFPSDAFAGAEELYAVGDVEVVHHGEELARCDPG